MTDSSTSNDAAALIPMQEYPLDTPSLNANGAAVLDPNHAYLATDLEEFDARFNTSVYTTPNYRALGRTRGMAFNDPNSRNAFVIQFPTGDRQWVIGDVVLNPEFVHIFISVTEEDVLALYEKHNEWRNLKR